MLSSTNKNGMFVVVLHVFVFSFFEEGGIK